MPSKAEVGKRGEQLAAELLQSKGYSLLARNWRYKRAEVDIIAQRQKLLVFVEVKVRKNNRFGFPEQMVSVAQQERLQQAATAYMEQHFTSQLPLLRFDIIAITLEPAEIVHFEDAF